MLLRVSSTVVPIVRRSNYIIQHLASSHNVGGRPVRRLREGHVQADNKYNKLIIKHDFVH